MRRRLVRVAGHLAGGVDAVGDAKIAPGERTQVVHAGSVVEEGGHGPGGEARIADHLVRRRWRRGLLPAELRRHGPGHSRRRLQYRFGAACAVLSESGSAGAWFRPGSVLVVATKT